MREAFIMERSCRNHQKKADIKIDIIDGKKKRYYCGIRFKTIHSTDKAYLYVDVGGGSTEFSLFYEGKSSHLNRLKTEPFVC